jgi:exosome complex RNA-binding protein Rrp4
MSCKKKRKGPAVSVPPKDVHQDQVRHWPFWLDKRQHCRIIPGCKGCTWVECLECKVSLCVSKNKNCFKSFHLN